AARAPLKPSPPGPPIPGPRHPGGPVRPGPLLEKPSPFAGLELPEDPSPMAVASSPSSSPGPDRRGPSSGRAGTGSAVATESRLAFRAALGRYKPSRLAAIRLAQGGGPGTQEIRPAASADEITAYLDQPAAVEAIAARLSIGPRLALS